MCNMDTLLTSSENIFEVDRLKTLETKLALRYSGDAKQSLNLKVDLVADGVTIRWKTLIDSL